MRSAVMVAAGAALAITALAVPAGGAPGGVTVKQDLAVNFIDTKAWILVIMDGTPRLPS